MGESNAPQMVTVMAAMVTAALGFLALRLFCKARYGKRFGWDDGAVCFSSVCLLIFLSLTVASTQHGLGSHIEEIPPAQRTKALLLLYVGAFFAVVAIAAGKTSFAITLLRLATQSWHAYLLWSVILSLNIVLGVLALLPFVQCSPVQKLWDLDAPGACWEPHIPIYYGIFANSYSAAMDFLLALFPSMLLWQAHMDLKEKIGIIVAMSLGVLAGITAAIKTSYLFDMGRWSDFTFKGVNLLIWASVEVSVIIIATSIPYIRLVAKEASGRRSQDVWPGRSLHVVRSRQDSDASCRSSRPIAGVHLRPDSTKEDVRVRTRETALPDEGRGRGRRLSEDIV